jgi:hypothetical protein
MLLLHSPGCWGAVIGAADELLMVLLGLEMQVRDVVLLGWCYGATGVEDTG